MKYNESDSTYTWAHIVAGYSAAFRKSTRFHARQQIDNSCWVGSFTWGSPIVATAPPPTGNFKSENIVRNEKYTYGNNTHVKNLKYGSSRSRARVYRRPTAEPPLYKEMAKLARQIHAIFCGRPTKFFVTEGTCAS